MLVSATKRTGDDKKDYFPSSFIDCFIDWQTEWKEAGRKKGETPPTWHAPAQADFEKLEAAEASIPFIGFVGTYECTGICNEGLFHLSRHVNKGKPSTTCISGIQEGLKDSAPFVRWSLITAILTFVLWLFQFILWFKLGRK